MKFLRLLWGILLITAFCVIFVLIANSGNISRHIESAAPLAILAFIVILVIAYNSYDMAQNFMYLWNSGFNLVVWGIAALFLPFYSVLFLFTGLFAGDGGILIVSLGGALFGLHAWKKFDLCIEECQSSLSKLLTQANNPVDLESRWKKEIGKLESRLEVVELELLGQKVAKKTRPSPQQKPAEKPAQIKPVPEGMESEDVPSAVPSLQAATPDAVLQSNSVQAPIQVISQEQAPIQVISQEEAPVQAQEDVKPVATPLFLTPEIICLPVEEQKPTPVSPTKQAMPRQKTRAVAGSFVKKEKIAKVTKFLGAKSSDASLETFIGEKLLSYAGIVILVLGLAFFLAYSLTKMGPAGRTLVGMLLGGGLLTLGVILERKEKYDLFGRILMAGGWATLYFTTFGAHHIDAMKVIENPVLGTVLLAIVAGAIIAHTLKYASETLTGVALLLGYITLFITNVTWYTHTATFFIAVLICVFVWKFHWFMTQIVGLVLLYAGYGTWLYYQGPKHLPEDRMEYLVVTFFLISLWAMFKAPDFSKKTHPLDDTILPLVGILNLLALALVRKIAHITFNTFGSPASALTLCSFYLIFAHVLKSRGRMRIYRLDSTIATILILIGLWFAMGTYSYRMIAWMVWGTLVFAYSLYFGDRYFRTMSNIVVGAALVLVLGGELPQQLFQFCYRLFSGELFLNVPTNLPPGGIITPEASGAVGLLGASLLYTGGFISWFWWKEKNEKWEIEDIAGDRILHIVATVATLVAFYKLCSPITCVYAWMIFGAVLFQYGVKRDEFYLRFLSHLVILWSVACGSTLGLTKIQTGMSIGFGAMLMYLDGFLTYLYISRERLSQEESIMDKALTVAATVAMMVSSSLVLSNFAATLFWLALSAAIFYYSFGRHDEFIRFVSHSVVLLVFVRGLITVLMERDIVTILGHWRTSSAVINMTGAAALFYLHTYILRSFLRAEKNQRAIEQEEFCLVTFANAMVFFILWYTLPTIAIAIAYALCSLIFLELGQKWHRTYLQTHSNIAIGFSAFWLFTVNIGASGYTMGISRGFLMSIPVVAMWLYAGNTWFHLVSDNRPVMLSQERSFPSVLSYLNFAAILTIVYQHLHGEGVGWALYGLLLLALSIFLKHSRYSLQALISFSMATFNICSVATRAVGTPLQYFLDHPTLAVVSLALFAAHVVGKTYNFDIFPQPMQGNDQAQTVHRNSRVLYAVLFSVTSIFVMISILPHESYSLAWGLYALVVAWYGLTFREQIFRYLSLMLFGMAVCKILLYDIFSFSNEERIGTFIAVGIALLMVSFLYNRLKDQLKRFLKD